MEPEPQSSSPSPRRVHHRASRPHRHNHLSRPKRSSLKHTSANHSSNRRSPEASSTSQRESRNSPSPRRQNTPQGRTGSRGTSARKAQSPFHKGLQDILGEVFGNGARGPTEAEMAKLAGDLGDLITNALVAKLIEELKDGLLERLLIEYLEEIVSGVVTGKKKNQPRKSGSDGKAEWKKSLMERAFGVLIQQSKR